MNLFLYNNISLLQEKFSLILGAILCVLLGVESSAQWRVTDFPHPVYQAKQCGRKEASWICDPNGIISTEDGKKGGGSPSGIAIHEILHSIFFIAIMILKCNYYDIKHC